MTTQITIRLADETVRGIDRSVSEGKAKSRADAVERAMKRERRREAAEQDALVYARLGENPELAGLAEFAAQTLLD